MVLYGPIAKVFTFVKNFTICEEFVKVLHCEEFEGENKEYATEMTCNLQSLKHLLSGH